jgi:23S rRNA (cytosine1962-C5)-methyltransferase
MRTTTITLKPGKDGPLRRFHPWVFSGAIQRIEGAAADGDLVQVRSKQGEFLGMGHFHDGSIAVRILTFGDENPSEQAFWVARFQQARQLRLVSMDTQQTDAYRLVHGEGDGLSGLIVDIYGTVAVVQCHSIGMHRQRTLIVDALLQAFDGGLTAVYDKSVESLPPHYASEHQNGYLHGAEEAPSSTIVHENGVPFRVDWVTGQKTGFFLDQRDNRHLLARFAREKSVLNTFCYSGGFSCYALRAGASLVHSVDVSPKAMALTAENASLSLPYEGQHEGFTEDVLQFLNRSERLYDIVVVDPPAYAKTVDKRHNAVMGYKRLNAAAFGRVAPGGLLFTFSCSQVVDRELFYNTIVAAAIESGRQVRVLHHLTQGADHPVSLFHPEGAYLKGLVLHVV